MHTHEVLLEKICESDIFHVEGGTQQCLFALKAAIDICFYMLRSGQLLLRLLSLSFCLIHPWPQHELSPQ